MMIHVCSSMRIGDSIWRILMITPGVMSAHYSIEYRTHFTQMHQTVIGFIGATEQLLIVSGLTFCCFLYSGSNDFFQIPVQVPVLDQVHTSGDIIMFFACLSGLHYNLTNIIQSLLEAEDKCYALGCLLPYAQFIAMMFASSYSRFFSTTPLYFIVLCGFYLTGVTATFNLCSTASMKFNWLFLDPFAYLFIVLYLDAQHVVSDQVLTSLYIAFFVHTAYDYFSFMNQMINSITGHMGIRFLKVKPVAKQGKKD